MPASSEDKTTALAANPVGLSVKTVAAAIERRAVDDPHINADTPRPPSNPDPGATAPGRSQQRTPTSPQPGGAHGAVGGVTDAQRGNLPPLNGRPIGQQDPPGDIESPPPGQVPCNPGCGPVLHPTPIPPATR